MKWLQCLFEKSKDLHVMEQRPAGNERRRGGRKKEEEGPCSGHVPDVTEELNWKDGRARTVRTGGKCRKQGQRV
jgi:hypothetical protein